MSRIGKKPITLEQGITCTIDAGVIHVVGPKGTIDIKLPPHVHIAIAGNTVTVEGKGVHASAIQGLFRSLIHNAVVGVKDEWKKTLELVGVGFRASTTGKELTLHLGFSHPVVIPEANGITFAVAENKITVSGPDKYMVGEIAATIRRLKKPEPYKGKGIRYLGEVIRKKAGKAAKAVGGAAAK